LSKGESEFELKQAKARLHILEGLKIAVDNIDAVIKTIREFKRSGRCKEELDVQIQTFGFASNGNLGHAAKTFGGAGKTKN